MTSTPSRDSRAEPRTASGRRMARNLRTLNLTQPEPDDWPESDIIAIETEAAALDVEPALQAWAEAEAALGPDQRLVMWQDRGRARFIQVLAPDTTVTDDDGEPVDDVMSPVISILADYPSKGLGDGPTVELRKLAARLATPATEPQP